MHPIHTTPGFIIDSRPYGEAGKLLSIFTRDFGLVTTSASGIRFEKSKLRYHSQDYSFGSFSLVRGKELWRLTSAAPAGENSVTDRAAILPKGRAVSDGTLLSTRGRSIEDRHSQEERRHRIEKYKIRLEDAGGAGGAEVMKEYRETEERDAFLGRELTDLEKAKKELLALVAELDTRIDIEFKSGILKINAEFQKYFTLMFGGGKAELTVVREAKRRKKSELGELGDMLADGSELGARSLELEGSLQASSSELQALDSEGPEGLDVNVSLPRKKVKGLMMLSGGERALTSIALLFAVSQVNPPPFIILDETDAALDEANSRKYGDMIEDLSKHSQLILITHNRETMSRAGVLYGVTMGSDGASRLLSIQFEDAVKVAK
jgi:chromosome segregation protein